LNIDHVTRQNSGMHFRDQLSINEIVRRTSLSRNTIYGYFRTWKLSGLWDKVLTLFRETYRISTGKNARPTAAIIDAQSVKNGTQRIKRFWRG